MPREKFNRKELIPEGQYPPMKSKTLAYMGVPELPPQPRFYRPITPKENFKMILDGKTPYWIPLGGWLYCDINLFRPRIHPDNVATRIIFDSEDYPEFTSTKITSSWFDLEWEFHEVAGGATVHPGNPKVPDIEKWEEYISIPDLDDMDFKKCGEINKDYLNTDQFNQLGILSGFWERLISLMDVEGAAIALIDEDHQKGVHRLFDQLTELYIEYIRRINEYHDLDCILIHDDWGHQHSSFFSINTCREMLVPYYKRVIDAVHELGLYFELHSCGKNQTLVPAMIEAGVDLWCPQDMNDYEMLTRTYKDKSIVFGLLQPEIPKDADNNHIRRIAKDWVEKYKDYRVATNLLGAPLEFIMAAYEFSRIAYQDAE